MITISVLRTTDTRNNLADLSLHKPLLRKTMLSLVTPALVSIRSPRRQLAASSSTNTTRSDVRLGTWTEGSKVRGEQPQVVSERAAIPFIAIMIAYLHGGSCVHRCCKKLAGRSIRQAQP